jgi:hypothetical protein
MTKEEIEITREYCKNDVHATYEFYKITIGDTTHPIYKENDQIGLRLDIQKEFDIPCLNYSDSKIGDEMVKKYYCQEKKIQYSDLPKKGFFRKEIKVKNCIAPYVTFKTTQLQTFLKRMKITKLGLQDDFKEHIDFYGNIYSFMKGGLHTENKPEIFEADEEYEIIDWDVSSYYPAIIINKCRYPAHLGKEFLEGYKRCSKSVWNSNLKLKKTNALQGLLVLLSLLLIVSTGSLVICRVGFTTDN